MTDQELSELVARKLGWREQHSGAGPWMNDRGKELPLPSYSNDMKAAWEIVEHLRTKEPQVNFEINSYADYWSVVLLDEIFNRITEPATSRTIACAICEAFLKLP